MRLVAAFCAVAAVAACGGAHAEDPHSALRSYAKALEDGRADDAYRLLSGEAKRGITAEAFRRMVHDHPEEVRELARALGRPASLPVVTATVSSGEHRLELVLENGQWKLDATAVDLYAQDTPRHAVEGFVRALERKRYDVVLRFVPDGHRQGLDAKRLALAWEGPDKDEIAAVLAGVKQALPAATIEETGDRAALAYGTGTLQLVRERGLWKIEDFD